MVAGEVSLDWFEEFAVRVIGERPTRDLDHPCVDDGVSACSAAIQQVLGGRLRR